MTDDEAISLADDMRRDETDRERAALGPSDATACSLPPHKAEKQRIPCCYAPNSVWWNLYTKDGKWTKIGPGGETLKLARQHALDEIREANSEL